ncbi:circadian clock protein KaiC [Methanohalophilus levihalophilus]|uniref:ATPase domain-containing protein n=1 Tax=Methanohalophilus levihalophilus TaxID=1431282 RepID=UPI001AE9F0AD|nr:ATPase domain-containing protein [Methanohalophilus levihalophilus]MBP2030565.1 circadian clock protein KaiC [Methanohalophilus levihalophilus]
MEETVSHIKGLDEILEGGLNKPSAILIAGAAGTGKTTMVMQSLFLAEKKGEVCMYVTSDTDPSSMVHNFLTGMSFYNVSLLSKGNIHQVPINTEALDRGIYSFMWNLEESIEKIRPDRIVIDPINAIGCSFDLDARRRFYYDLFQRTKKWGALVLITAELTEEELAGSELSHVVDGIIQLSNDKRSSRRNRHLEILKLRGQEYIPGKHLFSITGDGINVLPRGRDIVSEIRETTTTGIPGLDDMTSGGIPKNSSTLLCGDTGIGKTTFGLQYVCSGAEAGENAIFVSFDENANRLKSMASAIGLDMGKLVEDELVTVLEEKSYSFEIPKHIAKLEELIESTGATRVFVDDLERYLENLGEEGFDYIRCLAATLKNRNVTSIFAIAERANSNSGKAFQMDNKISLNYVKSKAGIKRSLMIQKLAHGIPDDKLRELTIKSDGIEIMGELSPDFLF